MAGKFKIAAWVTAGVLTGALATLQLQAMARGAVSPLPLEELQQFAAVYGLVKADYFEPVEGKKLVHDAITGLVNSLDPHSEYLDQKSFKDFRESTSGKFVGVGIEITAEDGLVKVVSPIEGSPAAHALHMDFLARDCHVEGAVLAFAQNGKRDLGARLATHELDRLVQW